MKSFVLGIDIGGTSVKPQLFEVKDGCIADKSCWTLERAPRTAKGIKPHTKQITSLIKIANKRAKEMNGKLIGVGIGSPGRFNEDGTIKPRTNSNLSQLPGEFDNVNLKQLYVDALAKCSDEELVKIPLSVRNDGDIMLVGMIDAVTSEIIRDGSLSDQNGNKIFKKDFAGKYVAFFGLGTGVGHAIAKFDEELNYTFVTDGHASKLHVNVDERDWNLIEALGRARNKQGEEPRILTFPDKSVRAEDLICSPSVNALAKIEDENTISVVTHEHKCTLQFAGKYMARLIKIIASGKNEDIDPQNGWSDEYKKEAAKTSIYFIGGGLGSSPMGKHLIDNTKEELAELNEKVHLLHFPKLSVAERAAAASVLPMLKG